MKKVNWYKYYTQTKKVNYNKSLFKKILKIDKPYIQLIKKYIKPKSKIIEAGCGPAKTAISLSYSKFDVTAIDCNKKMLSLAKKNTKIAGVKIKFKLMDFFDIDKKFKNNEFACVTHQGVLEHFSKRKIIKILKKQLKVTNYIIFSVPIYSLFNIKYFNDNVPRNLWTKKEWINNVLKDFNVLESKVIKRKGDTLAIVINNKPK